MLENFRDTFQLIGVLLNGIALGAAWIVTMAGPNISFDRLAGRADAFVRAFLKGTSTPIAGILLAAGACAILGGAFVSGTCSLLAAFGFFSNRWILAGLGKAPRDGKGASRKGQRMLAMSLSLVFSLVILLAAILGVVGL
jgi:hypothetical protein